MEYTPINFQQLNFILKHHVLSNTSVMILGEPGIGKSSAIRSLGNELGSQTFHLHINQLAEKADLIGQRPKEIQKSDGSTQTVLEFFPHATIQKAIDYALDHPTEPVVLFLDEINRTTPDITSAALSFITEKRVGTTSFPENIRFIAAGNNKGDIVQLDSASISRFEIINVKPDATTALSVIPNLNPYIKEVITENPQLIENYGNVTAIDDANQMTNQDDDDYENAILSYTDDDDSFKQLCVPRTIEQLSKLFNSMGLDKTGSQKELNSLALLMEDVSDNRTLLQITVEGGIGRHDMTNKLTDKLSETYNDYLRSHQQTHTIINSVPNLNFILVNDLLALPNEADEDLTIRQLNQKEAQELLVSLMMASNVNTINNLDFTKRTVANILARNENLDITLATTLYNITQSEPQLLSQPIVRHAIDQQSQTLVQLENALRSCLY